MRNRLIGSFIAATVLMAPTATPAAVIFQSNPIAVTDYYEIACNVPDAEFDVLANDSDPDSDPLTITAITSAPHLGSAFIDNNKIIYGPVAGTVRNHTDIIRYEISDGHGGVAIGTVSINMTDC